MSIFKKTIKAFGFSGEDDEQESHPYTAENITNACLREKTQTDVSANPPVEQKIEDSDDCQLPESMLDVIVEMLNRSLPDYAVAALDKEVQKKYLFERLGEPFKQFVERVNEHAQENTARKWETKHRSLTKEVEESRAKMKELEEQRNLMQNAQLSAERQKRAVTEKVHELETRIATLEAEKEQFELENKSLVNKLKVSNVHQDEVDAARNEIAKLRNELKTQQTNTAQVEQLRGDLQQAQEKAEQSDQKVAELSQLLDTSRQEQGKLEKELSQRLEQMQVLEEQLSEAKKGLAVMDEVALKIEQFEQIKVQKEEKISQLAAAVQSLEAENSQLKNSLDDLTAQKKALEQAGKNLHNQEIESLKSDLENANTMVEALRNQRQELLAQIEKLKAVEPKPEQPQVLSEKEQPIEPPSKKTVINFETVSTTKQSKTNSRAEKKVEAKAQSMPLEEKEETPDDDFPGIDLFDDNWLIPTRPDTPEMIAKRKEEEKKKREAEEQAALAQKKAQQVDSSQMSLW